MCREGHLKEKRFILEEIIKALNEIPPFKHKGTNYLFREVSNLFKMC
jgi:hypothetical protein